MPRRSRSGCWRIPGSSGGPRRVVAVAGDRLHPLGRRDPRAAISRSRMKDGSASISVPGTAGRRSPALPRSRRESLALNSCSVSAKSGNGIGNFPSWSLSIRIPSPALIFDEDDCRPWLDCSCLGILPGLASLRPRCESAYGRACLIPCSLQYGRDRSDIVPNRPSTGLTLCAAERRRFGASAGGKTWKWANITVPKVSSRHSPPVSRCFGTMPSKPMDSVCELLDF